MTIFDWFILFKKYPAPSVQIPSTKFPDKRTVCNCGMSFSMAIDLKQLASSDEHAPRLRLHESPQNDVNLLSDMSTSSHVSTPDIQSNTVGKSESPFPRRTIFLHDELPSFSQYLRKRSFVNVLLASVKLQSSVESAGVPVASISTSVRFRSSKGNLRSRGLFRTSTRDSLENACKSGNDVKSLSAQRKAVTLATPQPVGPKSPSGKRCFGSAQFHACPKASLQS